MAVIERRATLPPERESARAARRMLREAVTDAGHEEWLDNAELALSEVVTNALLHAHTEIEILVTVTHASVCVEVRDYDKTLPVQRHYGREAVTGRGLGLVAALAEECGVQSLGDAGKVVWFCVGSAKETPSADDLIDAWAADFDLDDSAGAGDGGGAPTDEVRTGGRDDAAGSSAADTREVVLEGMPVALWLAAREHHDAVMRELCHYIAAHGDQGVDIAAADRARSTISATLIGVLERTQDPALTRLTRPHRLGEGVDWRELGPERMDLPLVVPADGGGLFSKLQDALDLGESLAADGQLLVHPGLPEIVAVRDWACEQVIAQLFGMDPSPWPGTAQDRFETEVRDQRTTSSAGSDWDSSYVTDSDRAVVAADQANRIVAVSPKLAELLGWEPERLVGRRVVTIVPPSLREAHVAGFSRHVSTGESHVLGVPVELPVLAADGTERLCRLLIERAPTDAGPAVYVAWITPLA